MKKKHEKNWAKKIFNLTWHEVKIGNITIPSVARVRVSRIIGDKVIGTITTDKGDLVVGEYVIDRGILPKYNPWVVLIVSYITCRHNPKRSDLYIPWNKDHDGEKITGAKGIMRNPFYIIRHKRQWTKFRNTTGMVAQKKQTQERQSFIHNLENWVGKRVRKLKGLS